MNGGSPSATPKYDATPRSTAEDVGYGSSSAYMTRQPSREPEVYNYTPSKVRGGAHVGLGNSCMHLGGYSFF